MVSAIFTINNLASPQTVTSGSTVTLRVTSVLGVSSVEWSFHGYYPTDVALPTIVRSGSPSGSVATFTAPADPDGFGVALGITCTVNNGKINGVVSSDCVSLGRLSIADDTGEIPIGFPGEQLESNGSSGWAGALNRALTAIRRQL